jgi:hypothetical protein
MPQASADPLAHDHLRAVQFGGDVAVAALTHDPRLNRVALVGWQLANQLHDAAGLVHRLGAGHVAVIELDRLHRQSPARAVLHPVSSPARTERVARDADHPGTGRIPLRPVARGCDDHRGERLGGEVCGQLRITRLPEQECDRPRHVTAVERRARVTVALGDASKQLLIRPACARL